VNEANSIRPDRVKARLSKPGSAWCSPSQTAAPLGRRIDERSTCRRGAYGVEDNVELAIEGGSGCGRPEAVGDGGVCASAPAGAQQSNDADPRRGVLGGQPPAVCGRRPFGRLVAGGAGEGEWPAMTSNLPNVALAELLARKPLIDEDADRVGVVRGFYADRPGGTLEWAEVEVGLLGRRHLVPLADAIIGDGFVQVGYDKGRIERSPVPLDPDDLDPATEQTLYEHYGLPWEDEPAGQGHRPDGPTAGAHHITVRRPSLLERIAYA